MLYMQKYSDEKYLKKLFHFQREQISEKKLHIIPYHKITMYFHASHKSIGIVYKLSQDNR